jgi:CubicO group peptidase (beta-lactamase class C family)
MTTRILGIVVALACSVSGTAGATTNLKRFDPVALHSLQPQDPSKPLGQKYGYGISQITFGPNSVYFHGGEMPGYNSFMGYDPVNDVTLVIWTLSLDGKPTANNMMLRILDQI